MSSRERSAGAPHGDPLEVFALPVSANGATATAAAPDHGPGESEERAAAPAGGKAPELVPTLARGAESATCAGCGAPLAPDQRYCLSCGQPASPVRLAFLDVLQGEHQPLAAGVGAPGGPSAAGFHAAPPEPDGLLGALRRYSGLLALLGVLLAALLIGLLVGHWIGGGSGSAPGKQVIEVKGLTGGAAAAPAPVSTGAAGSAESANSVKHSGKGEGASAEQGSPKQEAKEAKEAQKAKAPPVVHKKTSSSSLQKLGKSTGKQHAKEVNELIKGDEPIETGH